MRNGVMRALAGGVAVLGASGLLAGCGAVSAGPDEVCTETREAFRQYVARIRSVPAAEPARWRQETEKLAGRLEELADEAADDDVKKALEGEADRLRGAAAAVGGGDVAQLDTVMAEAPAKIGDVCD